MSETSNFLIYKHETGNPHYDFYLKVGGEIKSWIIPHGIPENSKNQKVAVESGLFNKSMEELESQEILEDSYGAGKTKLWDEGKFTVETQWKTKLILKAEGKELNGTYLLHIPNWGRSTKKRLWTIEKIS